MSHGVCESAPEPTIDLAAADWAPGEPCPVCEQDHGLPDRFVYREPQVNSQTSSDTPTPSDLGIGLPAPLLAGEFHSDSQYVFLPWSDGLICSCPYKHESP